MARVAVHFVQAAAVAGLGYPFMVPARRRLSLQRWSAQLLGILAARLTIHGTPPSAGPYLLASNHVSWLDIFVINAAVPTRFVSKSEVRAWPLIGWLCVKAETLFIERNRPRDLARLDALVGAALRQGAGMGVFLEGTTTDGRVVLPFHGSLLRPALESRIPVVPVAIRYVRSDGEICAEAAYDGDKSAMDTLKGMLTQREFHAHVHFLPPAMAGKAGDTPRKVLAAQLRESIVTALFQNQSPALTPHDPH